MKPGKVLINCMFLFAVLNVAPAQKVTKYKRWLCVPLQLTNTISVAVRVCNDLPTKIVASLSASLKFTGLLNHFPLLTMC